MGVCNCSMFCCTFLYVHSSIAIILMGKRKLIALLNLSSWCLVMVERLFLAVPRGCLQFVIVVFPDHTHLLFFWLKGKTNLLAQKVLARRKNKSFGSKGKQIFWLKRYWLKGKKQIFWLKIKLIFWSNKVWFKGKANILAQKVLS